MELRDHQKIAVVGSPGSGKSWLATRLARITGYPLFHLDKEFWQPGWVMPPREQRATMQQAMISGPEWIIDGNYGHLMAPRFAAADLVIFLDINRVTCVLSALRRAGTKRDDLPDFLQEPALFSRDTWQFIKWIWDYPKNGRPNVLALHSAHPEVDFWRIRTRRAAQHLVS